LSTNSTRLAADIENGAKPVILDVRKPTEYGSEHLLDAVNVPLNYINDYMEQLDRSHEYHLHCVSGYRSLIMASILKARGFDKVINITDGWEGLVETSIPKTEYVCPTTL
jgi:rhodanese-related sulfurtransferase